MDWRMDTYRLGMQVSPFRDLRINGYLLLPEAFRSLSRLSSALSAKASTLRSFLFDLPAPIAFGTVGITMRSHRAFRFIAFTMFDSPQASLPMVPRMSFPISNVYR